MEKFKEGQTVKYNGRKTHIEVLHGDGTCNIKNPDWDYDEEKYCAANGLEYDINFWLTVNLSDLQI
jgi:hypothetical protein